MGFLKKCNEPILTEEATTETTRPNIDVDFVKRIGNSDISNRSIWVFFSLSKNKEEKLKEYETVIHLLKR